MIIIKHLFRKLSLLIFIIVVVFSCKKKDEYPKEPVITFKNIFLIRDTDGIDKNALIQLEFTDGDGDVGLSNTDINAPFDTASVFYNNLFIDYYEMRNGTFYKLELDPPLHARVPVLNTSTGKQPLKGTIEITTLVNFLSPYDTIKFEFLLADRSLNLSNKVFSPIIVKN